MYHKVNLEQFEVWVDVRCQWQWWTVFDPDSSKSDEKSVDWGLRGALRVPELSQRKSHKLLSFNWYLMIFTTLNKKTLKWIAINNLVFLNNWSVYILIKYEEPEWIILKLNTYKMRLYFKIFIQFKFKYVFDSQEKKAHQVSELISFNTTKTLSIKWPYSKN